MLVADDLVCNMLAEYIQSLDHVGCMVLDGFPRSVAQAEWLDRFLRTRTTGMKDLPHTAPLAIQIKVARDQLLRRLSGRRSCPSCGRIYNLHFHPTRNDGICDYDGTKLEMRPDDSENVVRERLTVHEKNTFPLTEYYRRKGQLREIDGNGAVGHSAHCYNPRHQHADYLSSQSFARAARTDPFSAIPTFQQPAGNRHTTY
jgi:adenylate kinase